MSYLTARERKTLNAAEVILMEKLTEGQYWSFGWRWFKGHTGPSADLSMFTPRLEVQHSYLEGDTFADRIESGLSIIADEAANYPSEEEFRAARLAQLRKEIEKLEAAA